MDLTNKQLEILYQIAEVHLKWFIVYSDNPPKYEDVLRLNHQKLMDIVESCDGYTEEMVDMLFRGILEEYTKMLEDYGYDPNP
jgi:hypothetical protein